MDGAGAIWIFVWWSEGQRRAAAPDARLNVFGEFKAKHAGKIREDQQNGGLGQSNFWPCLRV